MACSISKTAVGSNIGVGEGWQNSFPLSFFLVRNAPSSVALRPEWRKKDRYLSAPGAPAFPSRSCSGAKTTVWGGSVAQEVVANDSTLPAIVASASRKGPVKLLISLSTALSLLPPSSAVERSALFCGQAHLSCWPPSTPASA